MDTKINKTLTDDGETSSVPIELFLKESCCLFTSSKSTADPGDNYEVI
jgi:hypothetical protein